MSRRRPLHTFGASILAIIHNTWTKARELNGPVGSLTKRITTLMSSGLPLLYTMQYQWLAILSFIDDYILILENMAENIFPPSIHLFNRIDRLVYDAECLPGKFDDALNTFSKIKHQFPFLDWTLVHLISWQNFLISTLMFWGSKSTKEKDIIVDERTGLEMSIDEEDSQKQNDELPSISNDSNPFRVMNMEIGKEEGCAEIPSIKQFVNKESLFPVLDSLEVETNTVENSQLTVSESSIIALSENASSPATYNPLQNEIKSVGLRLETEIMKCSYKEMLEKGTKEEPETEEDHNRLDDSPRSTISEDRVEIGREKEGKKSTGRFNLNDPILELYEASWHLK